MAAYYLFDLDISIYPTSTFLFQVLKKILFTLTYYIHLDSRSDQSENTLNLHSGIIMRRSGGENRLALHLSSPFVWRKDGSFVNATSATMTLHQVFLFLRRLFFMLLSCQVLSVDKILSWKRAMWIVWAINYRWRNLDFLHWHTVIALSQSIIFSYFVPFTWLKRGRYSEPATSKTQMRGIPGGCVSLNFQQRWKYSYRANARIIWKLLSDRSIFSLDKHEKRLTAV